MGSLCLMRKKLKVAKSSVRKEIGLSQFWTLPGLVEADTFTTNHAHPVAYKSDRFYWNIARMEIDIISNFVHTNIGHSFGSIHSTKNWNKEDRMDDDRPWWWVVEHGRFVPPFTFHTLISLIHLALEFPSLRYLQFESRVLPSIETLARLPKPNNFECAAAAATAVAAASASAPTTTTSTASTPAWDARNTSSNAVRWQFGESTGATPTSNMSSYERVQHVGINLYEPAEHDNNENAIANAPSPPTIPFGKINRSGSQPKLPSLLIAPKTTASLDNCKCFW